MVERDKDGRPSATRNAGAFLSPTRGVVPVPSDIVDRHWDRPKANGRRAKLVMYTIASVIAFVFVILWVLTPTTAAGLLPVLS
jgi:hypothetical protein